MESQDGRLWFLVLVCSCFRLDGKLQQVRVSRQAFIFMSPTTQTLDWLRDHGYMVAVCEHWNHHAKIRQDLWGIVDVWAINEDRDLLIQTTVGSHHAERVKKAIECPAMPWLLLRHEFEVWSWEKQGPRGKRKKWTLRVTALTVKGGRVREK